METIETVEKEVEMAQKTLKELSSKKKTIETKDKKAEELAAFKVSALRTFDTLFKNREIFYVQDQDMVFEYSRDWAEPWTPFKVAAFKNEHALLRTAEGWSVFIEYLQALEHYKKKMTYSFNNQQPTMLNCLHTEHWLKPVKGTHNEYFDLLMFALGGCTVEGQNYMEQHIRWKLNHPEDFLLPCINWYDAGSVGKNFLMKMLKSVVGAEQVVVAELDDVLGSFNSLMKGAAFVLINEAGSAKVDMAALKNLIGDDQYTLNEKYARAVKIDNTAAYFIATNDSHPIPLTGSDSERRWSIIRLISSLDELIASKLECSRSEAKELWETHIVKQLVDKDELSKWINHLNFKWIDAVRPEFYHRDDYRMSVDIRNDFNPVTEAVVIIKQMTTWLPMIDLYCYVSDIEKFDRQKHFVGYNKFCCELVNKISKEKLEVEYLTNKQHKTRPVDVFGKVVSRKTSSSIVVSNLYKGRFTENHYDYDLLLDDMEEIYL
jgi:hypothetical protein